MKKIYAMMLAAVAGSALTLSAQTQITNGDFEGEWLTSYPWSGEVQTTTSQGTTPEGWCAANVSGAKIGNTMMGNTTVVNQVEGYDGGSAAQMVNTNNTKVIPGYISIGTTWNTAYIKGITSISKPADKDGGSFGGALFSARPDALTFVYKNAAGSSNQSTALAYLWKGTYEQADVPVTIGVFSAPKKVTMTNRDRNILGIEPTTGGTVTKSDDAELIAKVNERLDNVGEWTVATLEFVYESDATPEMINIAFAAGDYFSSDPVDKDEVTIDNVKLLYYHTLKGVNVDGAALEDFAADKYDYTLPATADFDNVECLALSPRATVEKTVDGDKLTVKVTNQGGEDADGLTEHTYTFTKEPAEDPTPDKVVKNESVFPGKLDVEMLGGKVVDQGDAKVHIIEYTDGTYQLELPDFKIDLMGDGEAQSLGDIIVPDVTATTQANGDIDYAGKVDGMSLAEGAIIADVDAKGTETPGGKLSMNINVKWNGIDIIVTFIGEKEGAAIEAVAADGAAAEAVYYNIQGIRINGELTPGIYIRRQGNAAAKVLVK